MSGRIADGLPAAGTGHASGTGHAGGAGGGSARLPRTAAGLTMAAGVGGVEATARICRTQPHPAVLALTMSDEDDSLFATLRAGARGYLLQEASTDDIRRAVRSVARGEAVFGPRIADRVIAFFAAAPRGSGPVPFPRLTAREREILDLLAQGCGNLAIGRRLVVSDKTVRNHVSAVLTKLQVASRAEAVALARDAGLGTAGGPG